MRWVPKLPTLECMCVEVELFVASTPGTCTDKPKLELAKEQWWSGHMWSWGLCWWLLTLCRREGLGGLLHLHPVPCTELGAAELCGTRWVRVAGPRGCGTGVNGCKESGEGSGAAVGGGAGTDLFSLVRGMAPAMLAWQPSVAERATGRRRPWRWL